MVFGRYAMVGIFNTAWGYLLIFGFMYFLSWTPEASNAAGYCISLLTAYQLNRAYTFRSKNLKRYEFVRYIIVVGMAYAANLCVLAIIVYWLEWNPYLAQILAGGIYVITAYGLSLAFVFRQRTADLRCAAAGSSRPE